MNKFLGLMLAALVAVGCNGCAVVGNQVMAPREGPGFTTWVYLDTFYPELNGGSTGSACVISSIGEDGKIALTAKHVVEEEGVVIGAQTWSSVGHGKGAFKIAWMDPDHDIAQVVLFGQNSLASAQVRTTPPEVGEEITIDAVIVDTPTIIHGRIIGIHKEGGLLMDATVWPGTSGGCVKDMRGRVLAIVTGTVSRQDGAARPISTAFPIWNYSTHHVWSVPMPEEPKN